MHGHSRNDFFKKKGNEKICLQIYVYAFKEYLSHCPKWEDYIKMDLREIGWGGMDWIDVARDRDQWKAFVNTIMNLRVP
jgi:hypothetical protein